MLNGRGSPNLFGVLLPYLFKMKIEKAERKQAKIRLCLQGCAGSGKTYSALKLARGLCDSWSSIVVIDTESNSAHLYSHLGDYNIVSISKPFSPEKYLQAIQLCEEKGFDVIIVDSLSHEWDGPGGILDIHSNMTGNSFTNWSKVTPRHNELVQALLNVSAHVVATIRTKSDYVLSEKNGKMVPEKVGLKGITKEGLDYEFTLVFDIDIKHMVTSSKDRTGIFSDKPPFSISEKTGQRISRWCSMEYTEDEILRKLDAAKTEEEVKQLFSESERFQEKLKPRFREKYNQLIINNQEKHEPSN